MTVAAFKDWDPRHFLSVGEMSFAVGIGYDWLYAKLTPKERATLKQALVEKSLALAEIAYGDSAPVRGQPPSHTPQARAAPGGEGMNCDGRGSKSG
jgi:hypothetical protein